MSFAKRRPSCLGFNVLSHCYIIGDTCEWKEYLNQQRSGATGYSEIRDLEQCKKKCLEDQCYGVDW